MPNSRLASLLPRCVGFFRRLPLGPAVAGIGSFDLDAFFSFPPNPETHPLTLAIMEKKPHIKEPVGESGQIQPWREWWPPSETAVQGMTEEERKAQPWVGWKPDPLEPNAKPWLQWVPRDAHIVDQRPLSKKSAALGTAATESEPSKPAPKPDAPTVPAPVHVPASSNAEGG
ncbi:hypothetical protein B0T16DRAFT_421142 [Cercophora newfieldiana]|uniref:Uncharacterized protein n=1 Tax=Cercophora newfieldiana TaxID=92897 RepID=A0AA39XZG8_9PEZI|nr:hypothetical protein B0T16DRAFT_421142 [Cercophora newfieldiana]